MDLMGNWAELISNCSERGHVAIQNLPLHSFKVVVGGGARVHKTTFKKEIGQIAYQIERVEYQASRRRWEQSTLNFQKYDMLLIKLKAVKRKQFANQIFGNQSLSFNHVVRLES